MATSAESLTKMTSELMPSLTKAMLQVKLEKAPHWILYRPSVITVAGHKLQAEEDLTIIGLSGGTPK